MILGRMAGCIGRAEYWSSADTTSTIYTKMGLVRNGVPSEATLAVWRTALWIGRQDAAVRRHIP